MVETVDIRRGGLTLDLLLHKRYGVRGRQLFEEALALNPHILGLGLVLPMGVSVTLPDLPAPAPAASPLVTLFGET